MAVRAWLLGDERFHAFQRLGVLGFVERVEHGAFGAEIGEVELAGTVLFLRMVDNMPFLGRSVEHNLLLMRGQILVRHVSAHAHFAAYVDHD